MVDAAEREAIAFRPAFSCDNDGPTTARTKDKANPAPYTTDAERSKA